MTRPTRSLLLALIGAMSAALLVALPGPASATAARPRAHAAARAEPARRAEAASHRAPAGVAQLNLVLPLSADTAGLSRFAAAVSTPGNPLYHHYRSVAWLARHFGASAANRARVTDYLARAGASDIHVDGTGLFVDARLARASAERIFTAARGAHANRAGDAVGPAGAATLPAALAGAATGVIGLDTAPLFAPSDDVATDSRATHTDVALAALDPFTRQTDGSDDAAEDYGPSAASSGYTDPAAGGGTPTGCTSGVATGGFAPDEYLGAYNYAPLQSQGILGQGERVALIEIDGFKLSDVDTFARCFGLKVPKIVAFRASEAVSSSGLPAGGEATLDLEVLDAAAPRLSQIDVYESTPDIASALETMTKPLVNPGYKPEVISASLGLCEPQVKQALGLGGIKAIEATFQEAAASGISVLAASGDDGSSDCISNNANQLPDPELAVNFPASSPYVTSVGGTNLVLNSANQITQQVVWNDGAASPGSAGGGGYSTIFQRPSYQTGLIPVNSRVVPDVAGLADVRPGYDIYCTAIPDCLNSENTSPWMQIGGTSASTPLLAGGLALVDEDLRLHKQQSLGLVNPLLYELGENTTDAPQVFSEVTSGSNDVGPYIQASHQPLGCCSAVAGYNAATGWGSVNLAALTSFALQLEPAIVDVSEKVPANPTVARSGVIYDQVTCTGACQIGAYAQITIAGVRTITAKSGLYHLTAAGSKVIKIPIPATELSRIRAALGAGRAVRAKVIGAIVDPAGNIESQTLGTQLTVR